MSEELKPANQHPDFGKVCIHGSLKRQCYTCELEVSNDWLKKVNQNLRDEIDRLKEDLKLSESRTCHHKMDVLDICRKENKS
jgi:hypothetical protein